MCAPSPETNRSGWNEEERRLQGDEGVVCLAAQHVADANWCVATGVCELNKGSGDAAGTHLWSGDC